ncbi:MAG: hypothetical protein HY235_03185 [Acidobacteria bacterium]|nr:hypothetical protein [Acidobacteriota bacterium]
MRRFVPALLWCCPCLAQSWTQWGMNSRHTGAVAVAGQAPERLLAEFVLDPFVPQAVAEAGGSLLVHYQSPLSDGRDVFASFKDGTYLSCSPPGSRQPSPCGADAWDRQTWGMKRLRWNANRLRERWSFLSDWKPVPDAGGALGGWEPVFHGAISERFAYLPAAGGEVFQLNRRTGAVARRIQPFGPATDANKYVSGPLTLDERGNLFYNVLQIDPSDPWGFGPARDGRQGKDIPAAWLVKVSRDGAVAMTNYTALIASAPVSCRATFSSEPLPWPPTPSAVPPSVPCLSQRPGVNVAPAIAPDGTVYTVSRAHNPLAGRYSYVIALNPDLSLKWAASLRDRLKDGCGVLLPISGPNGCRAGTPADGRDPATNEAPAGIVSDLSTSSPVVAPDGSVLYGALTRYNFLRGHLFKFSASGEFLAAHDFGWDTTPAIWEHDGTYSVAIKENNYDVGSYCSDPQICPAREAGPYYITQLDANLKAEWRFQNTNTQRCSRLPDGSVRCEPAAAGGFEWCINAPAVDALGRVYANAEDGFLYVIGQGGKQEGSIFLDWALGAAYTPLSIGYDGKIYTENGGKVFVVGK